MDTRAAYKKILRSEVGPFLRRQGFKGSGYRWTITSAEGVHGVVETQASTMSTPEAVLFAVNAGAVPDEWLRWNGALGLPDRPTATLGLWWERTYPVEGGVDRGGEPWWQISNEGEAALVARALIGRLRDHSLPRLERYLERDTLLAYLRHSDNAMGVALMLAERGPSSELTEALAALAADADRRPEQAAHLRSVIQHARERAAAVADQTA